MALTYFPCFIDMLDPTQTGLYPSFSSQIKTDTMSVVRNKSLYLAIVGMITNTTGTTPWTAVDLSAASITATIDQPNLVPTQGSFYLNDGSGPTPPLLFSIGNQNLQNALNALATTAGQGGLTCEIIGQNYILTWNANGARSLLTGAVGSLYPASTITITELQAGTSSLPEIQCISIRQSAAATTSSFSVVSGSPATMNGVINLKTANMIARFDALPPDQNSFDALFQIDITIPTFNPQTILQIPITVHRDVISP